MSSLEWQQVWESDVPEDLHEALAALLVRAYPTHAAVFVGRRSWSGARPEVRVVGLAGDRPVAHFGILRRFLRADGEDDVLVGDGGLVAVDPEYQARGVGRELLEQAALAMDDLGLPFGFLTCRPGVVPFYESGGWRLMDGLATRLIDNNHEVETYHGPAMVLPVRAALTRWPDAGVVDRNGLEV
jgi:nodulation protein A